MITWGNELQDALIAELLGGTDGAQHVLADFLEERGDARLADYARNDLSIDPHERLDFALGLMPYRAAVFAGCGFLEHVSTRQRPSCLPFQMLRDWLLDPENEKGRTAVEIWLEDRAGQLYLSRRQRVPRYGAPQRPDINSCDHQLCHAAWEVVEQMSYEKSRRSPPADIRAADRSADAFLLPRDSRSSIKSLARECRSYGAQRGRPLRTMARREADWQCQHTRDVLTGKITSWVSGDLHATEISRTVLKVEHDEVR